jgi:hypothetical protein
LDCLGLEGSSAAIEASSVKQLGPVDIYRIPSDPPV